MSSSSTSLLTVLAQNEYLEWSHRNDNGSSRYGTDFSVLRKIGRGSYGVVYKVQHRLDGCIYALKRIKLSRSNEGRYFNWESGVAPLSDDSVLREVQMLSRINHENVVRYYGAWIERHDNGFLENENDANGEIHDVSFETTEGSRLNHLLSSVGSNDTANKPRISTPICHLCYDHYKDWEVSFEQWGLINSVLQPLDLCTNCYLKSLPETINTKAIDIREKKEMEEFLYILMEYCDGTLMQAVKECQSDYSEILSYYTQCLKGMDYLHASGIIHRDIKPSNIFVSNKVVKIGDFGLATSLSHPYGSYDADGNIKICLSNSDQTSHVGTYLYVAPEVALGNYTEKCDVYSMGVVLVEILSNFQTAMERAVALEKLRSGELPKDFVKHHPTEAHLASKMLRNEPVDRASSREILEAFLETFAASNHASSNCSPSSCENCLARIAELEQDNLEKDITISRLTKLLNDNGISFYTYYTFTISRKSRQQSTNAS
jgi:eukaryotic translation initiation factor 2-alpha kinase 4